MHLCRFGLCVSLLFLMCVTAVAQSPTPYHPSVDGARCSELRIELANIERRLLEIDPQYETGQDLQLATDTLAGTIAALQNMKGDADAVKQELGRALHIVRDRHAGMQDAIERAMNATGALSDQTGAVVNKLKQAHQFLDIALRAERSASAADLAKAFADYYDAIKQPLAPLIDNLPIIGGFLNAYGQAVRSAAASIATIEAIRREQSDLMLELTGKDYYRHQSDAERELESLVHRSVAIRGELSQMDCDRGAPEQQPPDIPDEILNSCSARAGLSENYEGDVRQLIRLISANRSEMSRIQDAISANTFEANDLRSSLSIYETMVASAQAEMGRYHQRTIDFITSLNHAIPTLQLQPESHPPAYPTQQEMVVYRAQYLPRYVGSRAYEFVINHLETVDRVRDMETHKDQLTARLAESHREQRRLNSILQEGEEKLKALLEQEAEWNRKLQRFADCVEEYLEQNRPCTRNLIADEPTNCVCTSEEIHQDGAVWGDYYYTSDSHICRAAVHVGAITQNGGVVSIQSAPIPGAYYGVLRNGIESRSYGSFSNPFRFTGFEPSWAGGEPLCPWTGNSNVISSPHTCLCIPELLVDGSVWGTARYTDDSSVCRAAMHVGAIGPRGGLVKIFVLNDGMNEYAGSERNGVQSLDYGAWPNSFTVFPAD